MKTILHLGFLIIFASCQNHDLTITFGGSRHDRTNKSIITRDNGLAIAGSTVSTDDKNSDFYFTKIDSNGKMVFQNIIVGESRDEATAVIETENGEFLVLGSTESFGPGDMNNYGTYINAMIVKYDSNGKKLFTKILGYDQPDELFSVDKIQNGKYVAAGYTHSNGNGDIWVVLFDDQGNIIKDKFIGKNNLTEVGKVVKATKDGGFILAGTRNNPNTGNSDLLIVKLDKDLNQVFEKVYQDKFTQVEDLIILKNNTFIISGEEGNDIFMGPSYDGFISKLDSKGNLIWKKSFSNGVNKTDSIHSTLELNNGAIVAAGETQLTNSSNQNISNPWILKINSNGDLIWSKIIEEKYHTTIRTINLVNAINGFVIAGDTLTFLRGYDIFVAILDSNGNKIRL